MTRIKNTKNQRLAVETFQSFFIAFIVIAFVTAMIFRGFYSRQYDGMIETIFDMENQSVVLQREVLQVEINNTFSDFHYLYGKTSSECVDKIEQTAILEKIQEDLGHFMQSKQIYDKIIFLDINNTSLRGLKLVQNEVILLPENEKLPSFLKDEIEHSILFNENDILVTPMFLETDSEGLESPVMYFIRGLYIEGKRVGTFLIRVQADHFIETVSRIEKLGKATHYLLDEHSHFIYSTLKNERYLLDSVEGEKRNFMRKYPDEWVDISAFKTFQTENIKGLFTSIHISVEPNEKNNFQENKQHTFVRPPTWILVNHVSDETLYLESRQLSRNMQMMAIIFFLLLIFPTYMITKNLVSKKIDRDKLFHEANYDILTQLPNRALFYDRLDTALKYSKRYEHPMALFFMDLDGFKDVNDTLGHDAGDRVLQITAERLQASMRESDTVARIGGDEFTIILSQIRYPEDVQAVASGILKNVGKEMLIKDKKVKIKV